MSKKAAKKGSKTLSERQRRIYHFLGDNHVGVLATIDPNNEPHGAVIYHIIDKDFNVSFLTKTGTKKYDNLVRNNHVVLVVYEPASQTVAQVIGKAVEITDGYSINAVAAAVFTSSLRASDGSSPPVAKLQAGEYAAFRIEPDQIRMAAYAHPDSGDYDRLFDSIESFELKDNED
jgi:uncharacterized protein YhbP (UPF0306 family)